MKSRTSAAVTVTKSDIAVLAGVGRSTVSNWTSRHEDFPKPIAGTAASPRYEESAVRLWLERNGKDSKELTADRVLWGAMDAWRGMASAEEMGSIASALIVWRYLSDPHSEGFDDSIPEVSQWDRLEGIASPRDLLATIRGGMRAYEEPHFGRGGLFGTLTSTPLSPRALEERPEGLRPLIAALDAVEPSSIGETFEKFQERLTLSVRRGYDPSATSDTLVNLLAEVARSVPGPVHDPAAGSGRMLLAVGSKGEGRAVLTGQDADRSACVQVNQRALVTNRENVTVRWGDTFATNYFDQGCAQVVVLDPPYGLGYSDADRLGLDPRLPYGPPPRSSLDTAWLQIAEWYLGPKGRAFVLQPPGSAFQVGAAGKVRAAMVDNGTVEAIVALPSGLASHTAIPLNLWVLTRPGETADPGRVLFVDQSRAKRIDAGVIATALQRWREHQEIPTGLTSDAISVRKILASGANLSPARWLATSEDAPDLREIRDRIETLQQGVAQIKGLNRITSSSVQVATQQPRMVSVADLSKAMAVVILKAKDRAAESDFVDEGTPVVTGTWIRGGDDSKWTNLSFFEREPLVTEPGDVLVQTTGGLAARVDEEGGRVLLSSSYLLLRPATETISPAYLAEMIVTKANAATAHGTTIQRIRIQDLKIPHLPLEQQAEVVASLSEIRGLQASAQAVSESATLAREGLVEALAAGNITVSSSAPRGRT